MHRMNPSLSAKYKEARSLCGLFLYLLRDSMYGVNLHLLIWFQRLWQSIWEFVRGLLLELYHSLLVRQSKHIATSSQ